MKIKSSDNNKKLSLSPFIIKAMKECTLLQNLNDDDFSKIADFSHAKELPDNCILFEQARPLSDVYLLVTGCIKLVRLAPNGKEKVIEIISPGKTFAEAALFFGSSNYPVTAISLEPSLVVGLQSQPLMALLKSSNQLCIDMLANLSLKLRGMLNEVDRLTLHNASYRFVDYLLTETEKHTKNQQKSVKFTLSAPKNVIASRLSIKPETLSRTIKTLSDQKLIILKGSNIELFDIDKLRELIYLE
ncbi:MAG: Crp/Fnr family transcriptional regulator [Gammaproteobacteria bacterium]|nr:Crp/Fnr family transcriptional regulator [Gammaproteobacteria bacterium]